ncbi:MFS transporter, DHA1 family, arabinose polymer transporter [Brevibacterium sandarakinum]|uniref:MFS transporter, DHA1 family, arabinose polymer transporter n=1 Tax=Brevibacterium sandarakinum TaxID=629680 RepID=A0A1H1XCE5_BRESA|nr:MFS transporter [Brevibacterium sandarakinum]SDT06957.1 MFS transporter, DHA1 family, arabinose polymer transporter [Brevibacterium sandarakinum]
MEETGQKTASRTQRLPAGVFVLALGVFVIGTGEFVLAGLIPLLAADFALSYGAAGQVVTVFALTCALAAPIMTTVTAMWPRKHVLVTAGAVYLFGAVATALAPTFGFLLAGQIVAAVGTGLFIPNASVTAAGLVSKEAGGRAIAAVVTGFTFAVAFGAPAGTAIGALYGWRITMWLAAGIAALGITGVAVLIPRSVGAADTGGLRQRLAPLRDRRVLALLATTLVAFTAVYIPYTYIGAIFAPATGGDGVRLGLLMTILGVTGALGNLVAGRLVDRYGGTSVVLFALLWLILSFAIITVTHTVFAWSLAAIGFYGIAAFAITTPQQHRLISHDPDRASVVLSLNQAVLYLAIGASGLVGAVGIETVGAANVAWIAAALAILAIALSALGRTRTADPGHRSPLAGHDTGSPTPASPRSTSAYDSRKNH